MGEGASWQPAAAQAQQQQQQPAEEISDENDDFPSYLDDLDDDIWDEYNEGGDDGADEEDYMDIPSGSLLGNMAFNPERDEGGLGDVTLADIADDYNFPVEFIYDVLCRWGVSPPIKLDDKLGSLVNGEQAFAVVEALTSVDPATVHDFYLDDTIEELAWALDVPLADIFAVCGRRRFNLPLGAETHLTNEEYRFLLKDLGFEEELKAMEDRLHRRDREDADADAARRPDPSGMFMSDMFNGDIDEMFADDEEYSGTASPPRAKPFFL